MSKAPNLEVPQAKPQSSRGGLSGMVFVLLLILLVVQVLSLIRGGSEANAPMISREALPPLEQIKEVAIDLENKNIPDEAADLWEQYLTMSNPNSYEAGTIRFRIGKLRQNVGQYHQAFAQFALAGKMLGDSTPDLADEIKIRRAECLRQMGQYADLAREIAQSANAENDEDLQGQQIVAEVNNEKISVSAFDRMLNNEIDAVVQAQLGITAEEEDAFRKRAYEQFANPQVKSQELQRLITTRVLARESRDRNIHESKAFRERLVSLADGILASTLIHEEIGKRATVTDDDVTRFYEANRDRYDQEAATFIAHILCRSETHAKDMISRIQGGALFEDLAKSESLDKTTGKQGGMLDTAVSAEGDYVPLFGANADLHRKIRDAEAGKILDQPQKSVQGWHVIKVVSHRERIEQPLEEIFEQVKRDTLNARKREVTEQYISELFKKYKVKLYPEVFVGQSNSEDTKQES